MSIRLVIIGGVAGGATAAARARRINEEAEIILFERGDYISFANCGLPYYIGGVIKNRNELMVTTPDDLRRRYNIDVRTGSEVTAIDRAAREVEVRDLKSGKTYREHFDRVILSPGAEPVRPPLEGIESDAIFSLRSIPDTDRISAFVESRKPERAVVVGGGFIGIEMAENLAHRGVKVTILEMLDQVMPPLDFEMACMIHSHLREKGVFCELNKGVASFSSGNGSVTVTTTEGDEIKCDMVVLSIGVRPDALLARKAGLDIGPLGGIAVDSTMRTSDPDIFAVGDAVEIRDIVTGQHTRLALAGPANRQGRIAADNAMGRKENFNGVQGTSIVKVFDLAAASTGQNEKSLKMNGTGYLKCYLHPGSHASYYPGSETMAIKLLFEPGSGRVLGAQIIGRDGVDKRIDVLATAIRAGMTVHDLAELELAYAPPFSSAKDPVNMAGFVAANIIKGDVDVICWDELETLPENSVLIDLRTKGEIALEGDIPGSVNIEIDNLRESLHKLDRKMTYILYCAAGLRGYIGCRIMTQQGYTCKNLSGGFELIRHIRKGGR